MLGHKNPPALVQTCGGAILLGCLGSFQLSGSVTLSRIFSLTASLRWRRRKGSILQVELGDVWSGRTALPFREWPSCPLSWEPRTVPQGYQAGRRVPILYTAYLPQLSRPRRVSSIVSVFGTAKQYLAGEGFSKSEFVGVVNAMTVGCLSSEEDGPPSLADAYLGSISLSASVVTREVLSTAIQGEMAMVDVRLLSTGCLQETDTLDTLTPDMLKPITAFYRPVPSSE
jgi:hypothetical protein